MSLIVQKFGGSSVRDAQRLRNVAGIIAETYLEGNDVIVVLSAQGDTTDDLIAKAGEINPRASKREVDQLLSTGEQISVALCAMALESMGLPCVSLTAWQVGIQSTTVHGDARIKKIDPERIQAELDQHRIVIVAGFQGVDRNGDVTTLGRGGSDTSAVALAAAFRADLCQIYTDVDGVYTTDPRIVSNARKLAEITYVLWPAREPRCSTTAAWSWPRSSESIWKCCRAWSASPARKLRRSQKWRKPTLPAWRRTPASPASPSSAWSTIPASPSRSLIF